MENKRLKKPMPESMRIDLLDKLNLLEENLTTTILEQKAREMNGIIHTRILNNVLSEYSAYLLKKDEQGTAIIPIDVQQDPYISYRTIERYLKRENTESRSLFIIAYFLRMDLDIAKALIYNKWSNEFSYRDLLKGLWNLYYHDASKKGVVRSTLWLEKKKESPDFDAEFRAPWGEVVSGIGKIQDSILILEFNNQFPYIYMSSKLPGKTGKKPGDNWILNAGALVTGKEVPVLGNAILVKSEKNTKSELRKKESGLVTYNDAKGSDQKGKDLVSDIVVYLTRHRDRVVKSFMPDTFDKLNERNKRYLKYRARTNFDIIRRKLKKEEDDKMRWYSFSRVLFGSDIAIFEWDFIFTPSKQEVTATRKRFNRPDVSTYEGEVTVEPDNHLYIRMQDHGENRWKNFVAPFPREQEVTILYGISSTTHTLTINESYESSHIAVRELLIYLKEETLEKLKGTASGCLSYAQFLDLQGISPEVKLFLASRKHSTLSYPIPIDTKKHYARVNKARQYEGDYFVLLRDGNDLLNQSLLLLTLSIDGLANVVLKVRYTTKEKDIDQKEMFSYYGMVESYSNNLHMHLETDTYDSNRQRILNFMFDNLSTHLIYQQPDFLTGIGIDTNHNRKVGAYPFLMVKRELWKNSAFEPNLICDCHSQSITKEYDLTLIKNIIKDHIKGTQSLEDFFFGKVC